MDAEKIKRLLQDVKKGKTDVERAFEELKVLPYEDMGFAKIDTHRSLRKGFPEVVFCEGKSLQQITDIFRKRKNRGLVMGTRACRKTYNAVKKVRKDAVYSEKARIVFAGRKRPLSGKKILITSAGTADIPVAEEAAVTAEMIGNPVERVYDIGVAGIHRVFKNHEKLVSANVLVVVAGMDGALASIVGGLVSRPVIAVPTSVGYGSSFKGLAPLLTMLNSCAPGVAVMNIDNGFGAGYMASLINRGK